MTNRRLTCTQEPVTASQPPVCVSVHHGGGTVHTLKVARLYPDLTNQWGGKGRFKRLDADGLQFETHEAAWAYALERGYCRAYHTDPWLRARRVADAIRPRAHRT
jgi:hypothetical protein